MLIDRGGDDTYSAGGLAQGSAAQQAVAILIDLDGQDTYSCTSPCLGQSGDNTYHYDADKVFNFSVLHRPRRQDRHLPRVAFQRRADSYRHSRGRSTGRI